MHQKVEIGRGIGDKEGSVGVEEIAMEGLLTLIDHGVNFLIYFHISGKNIYKYNSIFVSQGPYQT